MPASPPNIVLIQADQLAAGALGAYGNTVVRTAHIDRLAERGEIFERAYCNSPVCAPSRASMLTGRMPSDIGVYDNASELPASAMTFAHHLRLAGYETVLSGKMHFVGPDQLHGFEERLTTDIYPADFGWTPNWDGEDLMPAYLHMAMEEVRNARSVETSMQVRYDDEVADRAVDRIRRAGRDPTGKPLFLVASFTHPHDPFLAQPDHWDRYSDSDIDDPSVPALPTALQDSHSRRLAQLLGLAERPLTPLQVRTARRGYYAAVSYLDDKVGELVAAIEEAGMADDTIIVFTSDHGEMLGERGLWFKMTMFEDSARVPLIIAGPEIGPGRRAELVSLLDLFPTFAALSGLDSDRHPFDDASANVIGEQPSGNPADRPILAEYLAEGAVNPIVMVRKGDFKYVATLDEEPMLFDVSRDPHELHDLAGSDAHTDVQEEMAAIVAERWDLAQLRRSVVDSQKSRRRIYAALRTGTYFPWDHPHGAESASSFVRNVGPPEQREP